MNTQMNTRMNAWTDERMGNNCYPLIAKYCVVLSSLSFTVKVVRRQFPNHLPNYNQGSGRLYFIDKLNEVLRDNLQRLKCTQVRLKDN